MARLLVGPDIDATAKKAVSRRVGEMNSQRDRLQEHVAELADDANDNTDRLAGAVQQALTEAQESLATASTPTEMRDFVETYVEPMVLEPDGDIEPKERRPWLNESSLAAWRTSPMHSSALPGSRSATFLVSVMIAFASPAASNTGAATRKVPLMAACAPGAVARATCGNSCEKSHSV